MANYCFVSVAKIKTKMALTQTYKHNYRIDSPENVDASMSYLNDEAVKLESKDFTEAFEKKLDSLDYYKTHKFRKDGVRALELVLEYSPEAAKTINQEAWKKANVEWLEKTFNNQYGNNVVSVVFHYDEGAYAGTGAIHGHAIVIPITENGHISAKEFTGPAQLSELQTSYAKAMEPFGLERGLKYSRASHQDIKAMYGALNRDLHDNPIPQRGEKEKSEDYIERLKKAVRDERAERHYDKARHAKEIKEIKYQYKSSPEKDAYIKAVEKENKTLRDKIDHSDEMIREMGGMATIQQKVQNWDDLNYAIQYYPNDEEAERMSMEAERMLKWSRKEREERERRDRAKESERR